MSTIPLGIHLITIEERKKGNVLFNNELNTFCLRLHNTDIQIKTTQIMNYSLQLKARGLSYALSHIVIPVVEHWLEHSYMMKRLQISVSA